MLCHGAPRVALRAPAEHIMISLASGGFRAAQQILSTTDGYGFITLEMPKTTPDQVPDSLPSLPAHTGARKHARCPFAAIRAAGDALVATDLLVPAT